MNSGTISETTLAERQAQVEASSAQTVVLVEGLSDCIALETIAERLGCALDERRVAVLPTGGVTNVGRFLAVYGPEGRNVQLAGLCDAAESNWLRARLDRAGVRGRAFFVCNRDLEDELIRSVGTELVLAIIDREGERESLRRMQQMPFHRGAAIEGQLHRFMGARSGRKYRYSRLLAEAVAADRVPPPLRDLVSHVSIPEAR